MLAVPRCSRHQVSSRRTPADSADRGEATSSSHCDDDIASLMVPHRSGEACRLVWSRNTRSVLVRGRYHGAVNRCSSFAAAPRCHVQQCRGYTMTVRPARAAGANSDGLTFRCPPASALELSNSHCPRPEALSASRACGTYSVGGSRLRTSIGTTTYGVTDVVPMEAVGRGLRADAKRIRVGRAHSNLGCTAIRCI